MMLENVRLVDVIVTFLVIGSTYEVSKTWDVSLPPMSDCNHFGADCWQVIKRSVRRIPVSASTCRDNVSTAIT